MINIVTVSNTSLSNIEAVYQSHHMDLETRLPQGGNTPSYTIQNVATYLQDVN